MFNDSEVSIMDTDGMLERLSAEYVGKCNCCDECFAEFYCIENNLRTSRCPNDDCHKNVIKYLKEIFS
jgi:hypothetical protein